MRTIDPFVRVIGRAVGAVPGRHERRPESLANVAGVAVLAATIMWLYTMWRQLPCMLTPGAEAPDAFGARCYTDVTVLYGGRGLLDGNTPYLDAGDYPAFEYPVLTGWFVELLRIITVAVGAPVGPGLDGNDYATATNTFAAVSFTVTFALLLAIVVAHVVLTPNRPWDGLMIAVAPAVVLTGAINWDFLPVALTSLGILAWARRSPLLAGALLGLGMAAKLYPLFILGPLLILCLRSRRIEDFLRTLATFVAAWLVCNLPAMLLAPDAWRNFWEFNSEREGDFGSLWYVFKLAGFPVHDLNTVWTLLFVIGCAIVAGLAFFAPTRPRFAQLAFLVVSAFLLVNKVYSPQYVLWLLPLLVLARPKWREWALYMVAEALYVYAIWAHLGGKISPPGDGADRLYWLATLLRLAVQLALSVLVARDILRPAHDPIRAGRTNLDEWTDDPHGGTLDGAQDAAWATAVRRRVNDAISGAEPLIAGVHEVRWLIGTFVVTRGMIVLALVLAVAGAESDRGFMAEMVTSLSHWDVEHFVGIAQNGYLADSKTMAFFPGLSMVLKVFMVVGVPPVVTGIAVATVSAVLAAWALYRMGGVWAAGLWLIVPTAVFTTVPYTEAPFCAFAFWAWQRARAGRWWQAGLLAAGASAFRVSGLFLIAGLGILALTHEVAGRSIAERLACMVRRAVWLLLPAAVIAAYLMYLHGLTGSWTAWFEAQQEGWVRGWHWPWQSVMNTLPPAEFGGMYHDQPGWGWMFRFELVSTAVGLVLTGFLAARRRWAEATFVGLQVIAFMTSYWLFSVNRATLLWFPLWLVAAEFVRHRPRSDAALAGHRVAIGTWIVLSLILMSWWADMFFRGQWAS